MPIDQNGYWMINKLCFLDHWWIEWVDQKGRLLSTRIKFFYPNSKFFHLLIARKEIRRIKASLFRKFWIFYCANQLEGKENIPPPPFKPSAPSSTPREYRNHSWKKTSKFNILIFLFNRLIYVWKVLEFVFYFIWKQMWSNCSNNLEFFLFHNTFEFATWGYFIFEA